MFGTAMKFVVGAVAAACLAGPAAASVVYDQPGTSAACAGYCWTSQSGDGGGYRTSDDFSLAGGAQIGAATWRGFIKPASGGAVDPAVESWQIDFYADAGGAPGASLYSATLSAAAVTTTLLGVGDFGGPVNVYEFSAVLPTRFAASGGTGYWFSPLAIQTHFFPFFSWSPAADTKGTSFQASIPPGATFVRPGDRAFSLSTVPEPAAWALMLLGLGSAGAMLRRRRFAELA